MYKCTITVPTKIAIRLTEQLKSTEVKYRLNKKQRIKLPKLLKIEQDSQENVIFNIKGTKIWIEHFLRKLYKA